LAEKKAREQEEEERAAKEKIEQEQAEIREREEQARQQEREHAKEEEPEKQIQNDVQAQTQPNDADQALLVQVTTESKIEEVSHVDVPSPTATVNKDTNDQPNKEDIKVEIEEKKRQKTKFA